MLLTSARVLQDLLLIARVQCGPETAVLRRMSSTSEETGVSILKFLPCAAWGKCRVYLG